MVELHRNTKIWLLIIGICIVAIIFFGVWAIAAIIIFGFIGGTIYTIYRGIRNKVEEVGRGEFKIGKNQAAYKKRVASHPGAYGRHPFTGHRLGGRAAHRRRFFGH